jgi:hypothetical protein
MKTVNIKMIPLILILIFSNWASAAASSPNSKFNFAYVLEGDPDIAPSQVFDDGNKIFLQFSQQVELPIFYADDGQGKPGANPEKFELHSPYIVLSTIRPRLHLKLGSHHAVLINQNMKQTKGIEAITRTLGNIFFAKPSTQAEDSEKVTFPKKENIPPLNTTSESRSARPPFVFQVHNKESLSEALRQFLETQGWRLQWNTADDFMIHSAYVMYGLTLPELIHSILAEYQLHAKYMGNVVTVSAQFP